MGLISVVSESSVGATNRRIESFVGLDAFKELAAERAIVAELSASLKTPRDQLPQRIAQLTENLKSAEKRIAVLQAAELQQRVPSLVAEAAAVAGLTRVVTQVSGAASADDVRALVTDVRARLGESAAVVAIASDIDGKPSVIVATNEAARQLGVKAGALAKTAATVLGGGGGGKDDLAQGGGSRVEAIDAALDAIRAELPG